MLYHALPKTIAVRRIAPVIPPEPTAIPVCASPGAHSCQTIAADRTSCPEGCNKPLCGLIPNPACFRPWDFPRPSGTRYQYWIARALPAVFIKQILPFPIPSICEPLRCCVDSDPTNGFEPHVEIVRKGGRSLFLTHPDKLLCRNDTHRHPTPFGRNGQ